MLVTFRGAARAAAAHHRIPFTRQLLGHGHGHDCSAVQDGLALLGQSSSRIASPVQSAVNKPSPLRNIGARDSVELPLLSTLVPPHDRISSACTRLRQRHKHGTVTNPNRLPTIVSHLIHESSYDCEVQTRYPSSQCQPLFQKVSFSLAHVRAPAADLLYVPKLI